MYASKGKDICQTDSHLRHCISRLETLRSSVQDSPRIAQYARRWSPTFFILMGALGIVCVASAHNLCMWLGELVMLLQGGASLDYAVAPVTLLRTLIVLFILYLFFEILYRRMLDQLYDSKAFFAEEIRSFEQELKGIRQSLSESAEEIEKKLESNSELSFSFYIDDKMDKLAVQTGAFTGEVPAALDRVRMLCFTSVLVCMSTLMTELALHAVAAFFSASRYAPLICLNGARLLYTGFQTHPFLLLGFAFGFGALSSTVAAVLCYNDGHYGIGALLFCFLVQLLCLIGAAIILALPVWAWMLAVLLLILIRAKRRR